MTSIQLQEDGFDVDAELLASSFDTHAAEIPALMRDGKIIARCERGEEEDAGRYRLTFLHGDKCLRLIVDEQGHVIDTAMSTAA